ncbi:hypothetical protein ABZP36_026171 [Zizania latifolia]
MPRMEETLRRVEKGNDKVVVVLRWQWHLGWWCREMMDWMIDTKGMTMSYTNHAICLDLIYKVHGIEAAEQYFVGLPDPVKNHRTYGALLNCYCSAKMEEKATDVYRKMDELGISSSTLPINNLMSLYMKLGQHKKAESTLKKHEGLVNAHDVRQPFDFLMSLYASVGYLNEINRLWNVVKATFQKITITSYLSMLQALYKLNDADRMKKIYGDWESNYENYDVS